MITAEEAKVKSKIFCYKNKFFKMAEDYILESANKGFYSAVFNFNFGKLTNIEITSIIEELRSYGYKVKISFPSSKECGLYFIQISWEENKT